jgi:Holliday junction resolvase
LRAAGQTSKHGLSNLAPYESFFLGNLNLFRQHKKRSPQVLGKLAGLWRFFKSDLKKHMHKSYKIDPACATAQHG